MPIKTDYIYNRDTDDKVPAEALLYYDKNDNTIKDIFDKILIYLDNIKNLDVESIDSVLNDYEKLLDDIQNEYDRIIAYVNNFADLDTLQSYLDKIDEINKKIDDTILDFDDKLSKVENDESELEQKEQDFEDEINEKCEYLSDKLESFIHPVTDEIVKKIIELNNHFGHYKPNNAFIHDGTILSSNTSIIIKVPRRALCETSVIQFSQRDTETTTYIRLYNTKTGEYIQLNTSTSTSGWANYTFRKDLSFLLDEMPETEPYIDVKLYNYQGDRKGLANLKIYKDGDIIEPYNHFPNAAYVEVSDIEDFNSSFQARSECDMYKGNYPYYNNNHFSTSNVGDAPAYRYYTNNNTAIFEIPRLKQGKYEVGILTYDFEGTERMTATLKNGCSVVDIFSNTSMGPDDIDEFKLVENGNTLRYYTDEISQDLLDDGWELFCPRSKDEFDKAKDYLNSIGKPGLMGPLGIYNTRAVNSSYKPLNSDKMGKDGWRVKDGSPCWWASDLTNVSEPNGDYTAGAYLRIDYDEYGNVKWYNDGNSSYSYVNYLVVKRKSNYKKTEITANGTPSQKYRWYIFTVDIPNSGNSILELWTNSPVAYYDIFFRNLENDEKILKEFKTDVSEIIETDIYNSSSKLPVTNMLYYSGQTFFNLPKRYENGDDNYGKSFINFKPYKREYYKLSFDYILSGSWDSEIFGIKLNDLKLYEDTGKYGGYNDKNLSYNVPWAIFSDAGFNLSNYVKMLSSGNDLLCSFNYELLLDKEQEMYFYNGLNEVFNNENLFLKDLKIEKIDYEIISDNYVGNWDISNTIKNQEIISKNFNALIMKNNTITLEKNLIKGNIYTLDLKVHFTNNETKVTDVFKVLINGEKFFGDTLSLADTKNLSSLNYNYTKENLYHIQKNILSIEGLEKNENADAYKKFNNDYFTTSIIRIKFVANGNDKIEIVSNVLTDNYIGVEYISLVDMKDNRGIISNNVTRIETGENDEWKEYNSDTSLYMDIDTSEFGFSDNVKYFTSLQGNSGNWQAVGYTSIYNSSKDGFRIYLEYKPGDALNVAKNNKWKILWTAVDTM